MKHWFGILGSKAKEKLSEFNKKGEIDLNKANQFFGDNWALSVEETVRDFVPLNPIWQKNKKEKIGLALHGIIFPREISIDEFLDNPSAYYKRIIERNKDDFSKLPLEFYNGAFVGLILKPKENEFYIFNSFLNHIPLYYYKTESNLYFSTSINLLSKCSKLGFHYNNKGILEYLDLGTNITDQTFIKNIYCLPKSSILKYRENKISTEFYYKFPTELISLEKNELIEKTHSLWKEGIDKLYSEKLSIGLGLTGGVDSRLIYAEWKNKNQLITFTGSFREHPDYVIAHLLTKNLGYEKEHLLEDYSIYTKEILRDDFIEYLKLVDNPLTLTSIAFKKQIEWRKKYNIELQLYGNGGETLGGEHYYFSRSSISGIVKFVLPFKYTKIEPNNDRFYKRLVNLGLRNFIEGVLFQFLNINYSVSEYNDFLHNYIYNYINSFINESNFCENYLERFRALYKYSNLLYYGYLSGREYYELISPYFSIALMDFALKIPLHFRNDRKLILNLMREYYPEVSSTILTGSIFSPNAPFWIYKITKPFTKGLNAMKIKIPYFQPKEIKMGEEYDPLDFTQDRKIKTFLTNVILNSPLFNDKVKLILSNFLFLNKANYKTLRYDWEKVWRLFCLALAERRFTLSSNKYKEYIDETWAKAKNNEQKLL